MAIDSTFALDGEFFFDHDWPCRLLCPSRMCSLLCWTASTPRATWRVIMSFPLSRRYFDDSSLVREWGRIGKPGRRRIELYRDHNNARIALSAWLARKVRRGYKTRARVNAPASSYPS
jgi:predicted DNA-binding WGR domain protein